LCSEIWTPPWRPRNAGDAVNDGAVVETAIDGPAEGTPTEPDASDAGPDGLAPTRALSVVVASSSPSGYSVFVDLHDDPQGFGACTYQYVSGCEIAACDYSGPPHNSPAGAGTIHVAASADVFLAPDPDGGVYPTANGPAPLWTPGASVHFTATGGAISGFDETLIGPGVITVSSPQSNATLRRDQPLTVQFIAGAGPRVLMALTVAATQPEVQALCWAPASTASPGATSSRSGRRFNRWRFATLPCARRR
jgi:hypothetical protein